MRAEPAEPLPELDHPDFATLFDRFADRRIITLGHGETQNGNALGVPLNDLAISVQRRRMESGRATYSPIAEGRSIR